MDQRSSFAFLREYATRWDAMALLIVVGALAFLGTASRGLLAPLAEVGAQLSLAPQHLPEYAARTTLRMFAAMALSIAFTLGYATWAAKSERAGKLLIPILDVLQSVPILGFISVTVVFFLSLTPGRVLGAEFAAIFAIFTSQAWNMAFSFYQSLRTVPAELREAADSFHLSPWMRFWRLEVPFAAPALIWNMMMSMSGGWFFVVAAEAISVGTNTVSLPGIGTYIALAIAQRDLGAIAWAIGTMLVVILIYDQLLFRPLVVWVDRFRMDQEPGTRQPTSWALTMLRRSRLVRMAAAALERLTSQGGRSLTQVEPPRPPAALARRTAGVVWLVVLAALLAFASWHIVVLLVEESSFREALGVGGLALITLVRVFVLIGFASLVWVPVGVWVGMRPAVAEFVQPIAQFLAAFPANLLFPVAVFGIVKFGLHPDIWLSPLMILGTQWYILFNVIAGASLVPSELRYAAQNFQVGGWLWWRRVILPAVFPFYVTGAITASGGSWNAAIVAEVATWGDTRLEAHGLGAYIASATMAGDFHHVVLGVATMSVFVVLINRLFWRPLYYYAERKYSIR
ncbi:MAG TPA: ABC transporter permease subunit [Gammaproteobacteria bacterium]|jgi:NitT/TauT family transport system permease protein|nr:ABC transporter permease subunit [Gammaproteobacteria bacterium]